MIIEPGKMLLGGNSLYVLLGRKTNELSRFLAKKGEKWIEKGEPMVLTNVDATWSNAHSILFTFLVNGKDKYQCFLQSKDFVEKYKENNEKVNLSEEEMFRCCAENISLWFQRN